MNNQQYFLASIMICMFLEHLSFVSSEQNLPPEEFWESWQGFDGTNATQNLENLTKLCRRGQIPFMHVMEFMNNVIRHDDLYDLIYIYTYKENIHLCKFCEQALKSLGLLAEPMNVMNQKLRGKPLFTVALDVEVSQMVNELPLEELPLITYLNNETMKVYFESDFSFLAMKNWIENEVKVKLTDESTIDYRKWFIQVVVTGTAIVFGYFSVGPVVRLFHKIFFNRGFVGLLIVIWCIGLSSGFLVSKITEAPLIDSQIVYWRIILPHPMKQTMGEACIIGGLYFVQFLSWLWLMNIKNYMWISEKWRKLSIFQQLTMLLFILSLIAIPLGVTILIFDKKQKFSYPYSLKFK